MTRVSRRTRGTKFEKQLVSNFWAAVNALNDQERIYFFSKILTPTEKAVLSKRLVILLELWRGKSYEEIEAKYKVISNTISRMSNALVRSPKLPSILRKISNARHMANRRRSLVSRRISGSRTLAGTKRLLGL